MTLQQEFAARREVLAETHWAMWAKMPLCTLYSASGRRYEEPLIGSVRMPAPPDELPAR